MKFSVLHTFRSVHFLVNRIKCGNSLHARFYLKPHVTFAIMLELNECISLNSPLASPLKTFN